MVDSASGARSETPGQTRDSDDSDRDSGSDDDLTVLANGHAASNADVHAIAAVLGHYYAAAFAGNGAEVCSLMFLPRAEQITEVYGEESAFRGNTCAGVLSKVLSVRHEQFAVEHVGLRLSAVRVYGEHDEQASAVLRVAGIAAPRIMHLRRRHAVWQVNSVLDQHMP